MAQFPIQPNGLPTPPTKNCPLCHNAIEYFAKRGVDFSVHNVDYDSKADEFVDSPNTAEMYRRCGEKVDIVPQIFVGDRHIRGWKALEPMIDSGEIEEYLA